MIIAIFPYVCQCMRAAHIGAADRIATFSTSASLL